MSAPKKTKTVKLSSTKSEKKKQARKLTEVHKQVIIRMLGAYCSGSEIVDHLKSEYSIKIDLSNVTYYKKHRREAIQEAREKFLSDLEVLPVADKAYRIKLRQDLVNDILKPDSNGDNKLWMTELNANGLIARYRGNHTAINQILDSVKAELEPHKFAMTDKTGNKDLADKIDDILAKAAVSGEKINKNVTNPDDV